MAGPSPTRVPPFGGLCVFCVRGRLGELGGEFCVCAGLGDFGTRRIGPLPGTDSEAGRVDVAFEGAAVARSRVPAASCIAVVPAVATSRVVVVPVAAIVLAVLYKVGQPVGSCAAWARSGIVAVAGCARRPYGWYEEEVVNIVSSM